ncbi:hypothetical protein PI124_g16454 [Phytophthora idaei]|nr:hypothetical protein PI125_g2347 [Phytophthora idaei]KAG3139141.1 hypothetical protein PI126_g16598 [Phytophthora idaei]KAG3238593.1 hypothetical protein PI124_g16454 [Phytophthora idaei]
MAAKRRHIRELKADYEQRSTRASDTITSQREEYDLCKNRWTTSR